jgi:hypothetical protein
MKMTLTVKQINNIFNLLSNSVASTLDTADKTKVVKIRAALKPIATAYKEFYDDLDKTLRPADLEEKEMRAQAGALNAKELLEYNLSALKYRKDREGATKPELEVTHELELETISDEVYHKLESENGWVLGVKDYFESIIKD